MIPFGREFFKMSGSGNDFVFVDTRSEPPGALASREVIGAICSRGTGIGADGVCFFAQSDTATVKLIYLNADGSRADLCGNASLCTARLARELGVVKDREFTIETDAGVLGARFVDGRPEIDLLPAKDIRSNAELSLKPGEGRMGFALVGVPHLVITVEDLDSVDVVGRGGPLRRDPSLKAGANVNFVQAAADGSFRYRTYERGVEAETLACGTGAVAIAVLLADWGLAKSPVRITTRSGRALQVRLSGPRSSAIPSLSGEARLVYRGQLGELPSA
ncbi:MAG TPA: diaminopimelate epimerase [Vicinamibacterales bacterium]|nr:diaminopimelate epimerase [Vicinamibacterales bacterium]